ncbi:MAG TPA: winged helix DNA-binding domain-containing protein [Frankiaceae bacterium]|nr:winged helix DNA-binding domain-containing protein [Frankiaceae bacterium]
MTSAIVMSDAQRRARLVRRHLLAAPESDPVAITSALVALHSTDPASVYLSAAARGCPPATRALDAALYEDRSLVRMLGMRRTMFVVAADFAPVVHAAATRAIAERERSRLIGFIEAGGLAKDGATFLARLEDATMEALLERGEAYGTDLGAAVTGLRQQIAIAGGTQSLTTRVLFILAAEGRIVRGRPKGSWISSQYSWAPAPKPPATTAQLPAADAQAQLARAYLAGYGPATIADIQWWTGWTAGVTKKALKQLSTLDVQLAQGAAFVLADDDPADDPPAPAPAARLLPALDPTVMGWTGRDFYLDPEHRDHTREAALFDRSGNPGPTVWWGGQIVGGWAQRKDGDVVVRLLTDIGKAGASSVESEAARTAEFFGDVRVTPRFRTALERSLMS